MQTQENRGKFKWHFVTIPMAVEFYPEAIFGDLREQSCNWYKYLVKAENAIEYKYLSIK